MAPVLRRWDTNKTFERLTKRHLGILPHYIRDGGNGLLSVLQ